jgi:cysteine desulfurase/selenocysteine lyase
MSIPVASSGNVLTRPVPAAPALDVEAVREDFPILRTRVHGKPLVYLDNAASSQKPQAVIDSMAHYYASINANVHRGVHLLSQMATDAYEEARVKVRDFLNAGCLREIVFTRGATEAINLVAQSYGRGHVHEGDEVVISWMEHHANIVPWQMLCQEKKAHLRVVPITDSGEIVLEEYEKLLTPRTRIVALSHVSNVLGTINPARQLVEMAHRRGIPVLLDGAQAVPHMRVDLQALDCDFFVFSGHKMYGPTGIGALFGKARFLELMPPYQGGGDMIRSVTFAKTTFNELPYKFEAGTPNIEGAIGLGAAIDYLNHLNMDAVAAHEHDLLSYATESLGELPGLRILGTARHKAAVVSFVLDGIHPHDIGTILDQEGIAVRTGHHCCQPLMDRYDVPATARASFGVYNTRADVYALVRGLHKVLEVLG